MNIYAAAWTGSSWCRSYESSWRLVGCSSCYLAGWPAVHTSTGLSFLFFCLVFSAHLHIHLPFNLHVDSSVDCLLSTELAYRAGLPVSPLKARMNASMFAAKVKGYIRAVLRMGFQNNTSISVWLFVIIAHAQASWLQILKCTFPFLKFASKQVTITP